MPRVCLLAEDGRGRRPIPGIVFNSPGVTPTYATASGEGDSRLRTRRRRTTGAERFDFIPAG
jgi:hypothetical protein